MNFLAPERLSSRLATGEFLRPARKEMGLSRADALTSLVVAATESGVRPMKLVGSLMGASTGLARGLTTTELPTIGVGLEATNALDIG